MTKSAAFRQQESRERKMAQGMRRYEFWLRACEADHLKKELKKLRSEENADKRS